MANLSEVIDRLQRAQARLDDAVESLSLAQRRTQTALVLVTHAIGGSKHLVGYLEAIRNGMTQVSSGMAAARGKIDETIAKVRELDRRSDGHEVSRARPSGVELVEETQERTRQGFAGFADRMVRRTGDVQDLAERVADNIARGTSFKRSLDEPPSPTRAATSTPTLSATPHASLGPTDIAGSIAVAVIVLTKGIQTSGQKIVEAIRRWKRGR